MDTAVICLPKYSDGIVTSIQIRRDSGQRQNDKRHLDTQFVIATFVAVCAVLFGLYPEWPTDSVSHQLTSTIVTLLAYYPLFYGVIILIVVPIYYSANRHSSGRRLRILFDPLYRAVAWLPQQILRWILATLGIAAVLLLIIVCKFAYDSVPIRMERQKALVQKSECWPVSRMVPNPANPKAIQTGWDCTTSVPDHN